MIAATPTWSYQVLLGYAMLVSGEVSAMAIAIFVLIWFEWDDESRNAISMLIRNPRVNEAVVNRLTNE